jgi:hypothetical protein
MSDIMTKPRNITAEADQEKNLLLETEARDLMGLVDALREELENQAIDNEVAVQQAIAASNDEIVQLKETASALVRHHINWNT